MRLMNEMKADKIEKDITNSRHVAQCQCFRLGDLLCH